MIIERIKNFEILPSDKFKLIKQKNLFTYKDKEATK